MAETYAKRTENRGAGITPIEWIRRFVDPLPTTKVNGDTIRGFDASGVACNIPRGHACLLFNNLNVTRQENRSNHGGNAPTVQGTPVKILNIKDAFRTVMGLANHACLPEGGNGRQTKNVCLVPLYKPDDSSENVIGQCGATWVGAGDSFKFNYHPHNSALMYMYAIQSTIWALANESKKDRVMELAEQVSYLVQAAHDLFTYQTDCMQIVSPLWEAEDAVDMLNRAISFIFRSLAKDGVTNWSTEDVLRILEISLKRWRKFTDDRSVDFVTKPIFGIIGIMLMVPALRDMVAGKQILPATVKRINDGTMELATTMAANIELSPGDRNKIFLYKLCTLGDLGSYKKEQIDQLYEYCMRRENLDQLAPLVAWDFIPAMTCPFKFSTSGKVQNKAVKFQSKVKPLGGDAAAGYKITSTSPAEWTPLQLHTPGIYTFVGELVGGASVGQGSTQGKTDTAIIRFTTGDDAMPPKGRPIEGISTAGMHYHLVPATNKWDFVNIGRVLDPLKTFQVTINRDASFAVAHGPAGNQTVWYSAPAKRPASDEPLSNDHSVMLGFKFLSLTVKFVENKAAPAAAPVPAAAESKPAESREEKKDTAESKTPNPIEGLTGTALLQKLAELKIAEKK